MAEKNMSIEEIRSTIKKYILDNPNFESPDDFDADENLLESGILDSLGIAEITEYLEATFTIEIDEEEVAVANYRSLSTLTALCAGKLKEVSGAGEKVAVGD